MLPSSHKMCDDGKCKIVAGRRSSSLARTTMDNTMMIFCFCAMRDASLKHINCVGRLLVWCLFLVLVESRATCLSFFATVIRKVKLKCYLPRSTIPRILTFVFFLHTKINSSSSISREIISLVPRAATCRHRTPPPNNNKRKRVATNHGGTKIVITVPSAMRGWEAIVNPYSFTKMVKNIVRRWRLI